MLYVILTILKIIGFIIAALLMILVLFLVSVLFIPLRYRMEFHIHEGMNGKILVSWLKCAARVHLNYQNNEFSYYIRLLGIKIMDSSKTKKNSEEFVDEKSSGTVQDQLFSQTEITKEIKKETTKEAKREAIEERIDKSEKKRSKRQRPISLFDKILKYIKNFLRKILSLGIKIFHGIIHLFQGTINLMENVEKKFTYFNENINTEENKKLVKFLWNQSKILLHHIRPVKSRIHFKIGLTEPDLLGKILGYTAMANAFLNLNLSVEPVYEESIFEGEVYLKGRIRVFSVALIIFRMYREKQFKKLLKMLK